MGDALGALGEWIGAVRWTELANLGGLFAAVAGIALTLAQLGLFRRQLKLDALIKIMDSNREIVTLGFEHPRLWAAMVGEGGSPSPEEAPTRRRYLQLWTNHMQVMWSAWRLGLVSGDEWEAYRQDLSEFLHSPALQGHWASVARFYPEGFQRLVSELSATEQGETHSGRAEAGPSGEKGRGREGMRVVSRHNPRKP